MNAQNRLSLLMVECSSTPSNSQRVIWELATRLPRDRYDVQVWLSSGEMLDPLARALEANDTSLWRMPSLDTRWDLRATAELWLRMRRLKPKLLHVHDGPSSSNRLKTLMSGASGDAGVVVSEHGGFLRKGEAPAASRNRLLDRAAAVTAPCMAAADVLVRDFGIERNRVRVVREGTDPPSEERERRSSCLWRQRLGAGPSNPLWVCAAKLEPHKGQSVLLQALAELKGRGQSFTAAIAGDGSMRQTLERRADELGLAEQVRFLGNVDDLGSLLRAANAVVVPSLWDAIPHVLFEALGRERPVVASAVGGIPEVVEDNRSGMLVPAGDPNALACALEALHRRADAASRIGAEGARRIRDEYTWERAIDAFEAVYDETLGLATFTAETVPSAH